MGRILVKRLGLDGYDAVSYTDPREALAALAQDRPDLILTDVRMPEIDGWEILRRVQAEYPETPVIVMTAYGTIEDAVAMLRAGAYNYITKPFQHETLLHQLDLALRQRRLEEEVQRLSEAELLEREARAIIGSSAGLERVRELIRRAAAATSTVLITGESGVGKELVAREIHRLSSRRQRRFVTVNCPAIPATLIESEMFGYERGAFTGADAPKMGLIELSAAGTLFLDEIGELPLDLQVKLLRVLQEREVQRLGSLRPIPVDLRIISATNRDLDREVREGRFRPELFYRLNVIAIAVPPLRERPDDIPELAAHFLARLARRHRRPGLRLSAEALERLKTAPWPGNIRQLENLLERMVVLSSGPVLEIDEAPAELKDRGAGAPGAEAGAAAELENVRFPTDFRRARDQFERAYLAQLLRDCQGNVARAARASGISRRALYEKFERLGLVKARAAASSEADPEATSAGSETTPPMPWRADPSPGGSAYPTPPSEQTLNTGIPFDEVIRKPGST